MTAYRFAIFTSENGATFVTAALLHWIILTGLTVVACISVLGDMFFLPTCSHALHLLKLGAGGSAHLSLGLHCWFRLRSHLVDLLLWLLLLRWLILLLRLRCRLLLLIWMTRLTFITRTYKAGILILLRFWSVSLVLIQITRFLWLQLLLHLPLINRLPVFEAINVAGCWVFFELKLIWVINCLVLRFHNEIFTCIR